MKNRRIGYITDASIFLLYVIILCFFKLVDVSMLKLC